MADEWIIDWYGCVHTFFDRDIYVARLHGSSASIVHGAATAMNSKPEAQSSFLQRCF